MRLTLRTLLAYLDDRLSPAHARELGQKVSSSPFATELADRIRDVLRRRRLATESAGRKTVDANLVAEYLDDQLTPELVALIEREILASDHSLAEVAAAHQILGLLNDPVDLEPGLRRRLMAMSPESESDDSSESGMKTSAEVPEWKPLAAPETSKQRSPLALLLIMVLGWLVLLATDPHLFKKPQPELAVAGPPEVVAPRADGDVAPKQDENPTEPVSSPEVSANASDAAESLTPLEESAAAKPADAVAASGTDETSVSSTVADSPKATEEPSPTEPSATTTPAVAMVDKAASPAGETAASVTPATSPAVSEAGTADAVGESPKRTFEFNDEMSMLLISDTDAGSWSWRGDSGESTGRLKASDEILAVPAPFSVEVECVEAGWSVSLLSQAMFRLIDGAACGVSLIEGRMVLKGTSLEEPEAFELQVAGGSAVVTVPKADGVVAIEVIPQPSQAGAGNTGDDIEDDQLSTLLPLSSRCEVLVHAVEGDAELRRQGDDVITVKAGTTLRWLTSDSDEATSNTEETIPEWVFESAVPLADVTLKSHAIVSETLRSGSSLSDGVNILSRHRNPDVAAYSAMIPAMLWSVDELVTLLIESEQGTVRREAVRGLTSIAQQSAVGRDRVNQALGNRLSEAEMENAVRLVQGISETAAEDPRTSNWLIDMLSENRLTIRELAIFNLESLIGDRLGYFADDDRRSSSIRRWTRLLEKNDGRLVVPVEE